MNTSCNGRCQWFYKTIVGVIALNIGHFSFTLSTHPILKSIFSFAKKQTNPTNNSPTKMKHFIALAVVAIVAVSFVEGAALDLKATLIAQGKQLEKKAEEEIKKLTAENKTHEAAVLKTEEAKIKALIASLEKETNEAKIKTLEQELKGAEMKLASELAKIGAKDDSVKEALLKRATALEKKANELIKKLKAENKESEAATVEKDEALVKKIAAELKSASTSEQVKKLEKELVEAERRLAKDLTKP
ncbi:hypothetical protein TYRP_014605 [Tyrophagus putrescentiae]|nr:hypothetical protein TYRP_014605 [Tyrophagus putrescentiae]